MKVVKHIDDGGFGTVEQVETESGAIVARKTFKPTRLDPDGRLRGRFIREVRTQSKMKHPNIMEILEAHLEDDPPWFTMPVATCSYRTKIAEDCAKGEIDIKPWMDILSGVEEIHRLGLIHRDLKPENILCVNDVWVISDFGTVLPPTRDTTTLTKGTNFGSEQYAPPEQALDFKHVTQVADIFALGCILHDMIGNRFERVPYAQLAGCGHYSGFLSKCTDPNPNRRYKTIAEVRAALFDIWQKGVKISVAAGKSIALDDLLSKLARGEGWKDFVDFLEAEDTPTESRSLALRAVSAETISTLHAVDDSLFDRLATAYCEWIESSRFDFNYCDILGDRLKTLYDLGLTRVKLRSVLASMELAVDHNRWHVMRHVVTMLNSSADLGLVDRMVMELTDEPSLRCKLIRIEVVLRLSRSAWHERIGAVIES